MNKYSAIILLTVFFVAQYAKQVSYLECKLSNSFNTGSQHCDCGKIMMEKKNVADSPSVPVLHNHLHLDDLYDTREKLIREVYSRSAINYCLSAQAMITEGVTGPVDHPPQIS